MPKPTADALRSLNSDRAAFKAFLVRRLGNEADAEDVLQNSLLKAMTKADALKDGEKITAWFYRILRNAVTDTYRARGAVRKRDVALKTLATATGEDVAMPSEWEAQICRCIEAMIPSLKPQAAELIRRVELNGEPVQVAAKELGITSSNASVTLHRARKELGKQLETFCGECASGACLDCDCN
jgi:RNA polymerase sigma factor (sigma-70 family)